MYRRILTKFKKLDRTKQGIIAGATVAIVILVIFLITQLNQPERSVASYCKVYRQEKARLSMKSNNSNPYPSGLFNVSVTDASQIAISLGKLDRVAPNEIEPELSSLQKLYQDIHDNPSHAINDSLSGGSLDDSLKSWTQQSCSTPNAR